MKKIILLILMTFLLSGCFWWNTDNNWEVNNTWGQHLELNEETDWKDILDVIEENIVLEEEELWEKINIEDLESGCNEKTSVDDKFYIFAWCWEADETIYVVWEYKSTKEIYDKEYKLYSEKWPVCDYDTDKTIGILSVKCKKGEYGNFSMEGKIITYTEFKKGLMWQMLLDYDKSLEIGKEIQEKKWLAWVQDFPTFIDEVKKWTYAWIDIEEKWDECPYLGMWDYTKHWNNKETWTKYLCKVWTIKAIDYYVDNIKVSKNDYLRKFYQEERERLWLTN